MVTVSCGERLDFTEEIGVVAAQDVSDNGEKYSYVLICPLSSTRGSANILSNLNVTIGAVLPKSQLPRLISDLKLIVEHWDLPMAKVEGEFWEFVSTAEHREHRVSDSVISYYPSIRIANSKVGDANFFTVVISENLVDYWWTERLPMVQCLIAKLEAAAITFN